MKNRFLISVLIAGIILVCFGLIVFVNGDFLKLKPGRKTDIVKKAVNTEVPSIEKKNEIEESKSKDILVSEPKKSDDFSDKESLKIKTLMEELGSDNLETSQDAAEKLVKFNKAVIPSLLDGLKKTDGSLKGQIAFLLGRIGNREAVVELIGTLKDENAYVRRNSASATASGLTLTRGKKYYFIVPITE